MQLEVSEHPVHQPTLESRAPCNDLFIRGPRETENRRRYPSSARHHESSKSSSKRGRPCSRTGQWDEERKDVVFLRVRLEGLGYVRSNDLNHWLRVDNGIVGWYMGLFAGIIAGNYQRDNEDSVVRSVTRSSAELKSFLTPQIVEPPVDTCAELSIMFFPHHRVPSIRRKLQISKTLTAKNFGGFGVGLIKRSSKVVSTTMSNCPSGPGESNSRRRKRLSPCRRR